MPIPSNRREFLKRLTLSGMAATSAVSLGAAETPAPGPMQVPRQRLGKTGADVSILGLGLGSVFTRPFADDREGMAAVLEVALAHGINYWDTARAYGESEVMLGPVVEKERSRIFLVSKSAERSYDGFKRELELSLKNLRTDHLDLYHIHNLNPKTDPDLDLIENGAVRAAREAKEQGLIRNFGITGHSGVAILMEGINRWEPDAILTIFPADRPDNGDYEEKLLPLARAKGMGVIAMKTIRHARNSDLPGPQLIRYAMSLEGISATIVGLDTLAHLNENVAMASAFTPMPADMRAELSQFVRKELASAGPAPWKRPGYNDCFTV